MQLDPILQSGASCRTGTWQRPVARREESVTTGGRRSQQKYVQWLDWHCGIDDTRPSQEWRTQPFSGSIMNLLAGPDSGGIAKCYREGSHACFDSEGYHNNNHPLRDSKCEISNSEVKDLYSHKILQDSQLIYVSITGVRTRDITYSYRTM